MKAATKHVISRQEKAEQNRCFSCGTTENMKRRKYCSIDCRQRLRHQLNIRTGLLRALNTRYATFYFTDYLLVLDVLPYSSPQIFSYLYPRSPRSKPVDDFCKMANHLGNEWWDEVKRTRKRYLASQHLLESANRNHKKIDSVRPIEIKKPSQVGSSVIRLKLNRSQLEKPDLSQVVKKAYRRQAMKHHPDLGGDSDSFRKIHEAYIQLINWAESPTFIRRRGFPDKWFYEGDRNRWIQPIPCKPNK